MFTGVFIVLWCPELNITKPNEKLAKSLLFFNKSLIWHFFFLRPASSGYPPGALKGG